MIAKAVKIALYSGLAASLSVGAPAFAAEEDEKGETIKVTGSRIKRTDVEGVSPVQTYTKEDLDLSGHNTIQDFIRTLTTSNGNTGDDNNNSFANGTSTVNLRGLGNNATLVLVNGRRMAGYGQAQNITESFVDLNSIPFAAIERIEILKDGASALYGADAVAGVVNIILRKDFEGAELSAGYQTDIDGDGPQTSLSAIFGAGNDKTHFTTAFSYLKRDRLSYTDRPFSASADQRARGGTDQRSTFGYPGTTFTASNGFQAAPGCPADLIRPQLGGTVCSFNYNDFINFYPDSERFSTTSFITHQLNDDASFYADISFNRNHSVNIAAPAPWVGPYNGFGSTTLSILTPAQAGLTFGGLGIFVPATNPHNPLGEDMGLLHRPISFGPRTGEITSNTYRVYTGVEGFITDTWDYDVGVGYVRSDVLVENRNSINAIALQQLALGVADPAGSGDTLYYNPFAVAQDPRSIAYAKTVYENRNSSYEKSFYANFSGPIFEMGGGEAGLAVGVEFREQTYIAEADSLRNIGGLVGTGQANDTRGFRDLTSIYAELALPFTDTFEVQVAARHEDYSDFGTTTKPKIGFKWEAADNLLVRASWGESFRAPSLVELFSGTVSSFQSVTDTLRCPSGNVGGTGNAPTAGAIDCGNGQFQINNGGNPLIQPEESESWNVGVVWNPDFMDGLTVAFDYFNFEHENIITQLPLSTLITINDPTQIVRLPAQAVDAAAGFPGPISLINRSYNNGSAQEVRGWDLDVTYQWEALGGQMTARTETTYYEEFTFAPLTVVNGVQTVGTPIEGTGNVSLGDFPQLRSNTSFQYATGDHAITATARYRSGLWSSRANSITNTARTGSMTTIDMAYTYSSEYGRFQAGCINCGDRDPVFDPSSGEEAGYFKSTDDPRGAVVYVRWTQDF